MHLSRNTLIFYLTTCLLAGSGYVYAFLNLRTAAKERDTVLAEIKQEEEKEKRLGTIQSLLESTEAAREELALVLLSDDTFVDFFEELEVLESAAGVDGEIAMVRENVELEPVANTDDSDSEKEDTKEHPAADLLENAELDISATGSWEEVFHFLSLVETMPYVIELGNVQFRRQETGRQTTADGEGVSQPFTWELSLTIEVLKYKDEA